MIAGTVIGVILGGEVGRSLDRVDETCYGQAFEHAPDGRTVVWRNPDTRGEYRITPTETLRSDSGRYCREYQSTATIDGRRERVYGTVCRNPDGSWEKVG